MAKYMRHFSTTIAIPEMLYMANLFLVPESRKGKGTKGYINRLVKIQRQVSLCITGTLRSAPMDTIDALADLLLFLLIDKLV